MLFGKLFEGIWEEVDRVVVKGCVLPLCSDELALKLISTQF